jgi:transcriptional regulator with XRE-family HTH domain
MSANRARLLGETFAAMIRRERLSVAQIMRAGRLARLTVENLRDGKTENPSRRTLTSAARAVATDPSSNFVDQQKMRRYERDLHVAAGYADPTVQDVRSMLELLLYHRVGSLERARAWAAKIDERADLDADEIAALDIPPT